MGRQAPEGAIVAMATVGGRVRKWLLGLLWIGALLAILAAGVQHAVAVRQRKEAQRVPFVATTTARRGTFLITADAVGAVQAEDSLPVKSETSGRVSTIIANGSMVKKGDVICTLDAPRMQHAIDEALRNVRQARDAVVTAEQDTATAVRDAEVALQRAQDEQAQAEASSKASLVEAEARLAFDESSLVLDQAKLERTRRQAAAGLVRQDEVRRSETDLAGRNFDLEKERKSLDLQKAKAESDAVGKEAQVKMAESAHRRAQARQTDELRSVRAQLAAQERQLQRARDDLAKAILRAPAAGMVALAESWRGSAAGQSLYQEGDTVVLNESVGQILDLAKMQVIVQLPQRIGPMVRRGQSATVSVQGSAGQRFSGKVSQVSPFAAQAEGGWMSQGTERTFRTCIRLSGFAPGEIKPGVRATVRITITEVKNAISVPLVCVFTRGVGAAQRSVMWVRHGRRFIETPVKLGQANEEYVIVRRGLRAGAAVALRDLQAENQQPYRTAREASRPETTVVHGGDAR